MHRALHGLRSRSGGNCRLLGQPTHACRADTPVGPCARQAAIPRPVEPRIFGRRSKRRPAYAFGSVTPVWPWYLPPLSLYEVSHTSSLSMNSTCAQPSPA